MIKRTIGKINFQEGKNQIDKVGNDFFLKLF